MTPFQDPREIKYVILAGEHAILLPAQLNHSDIVKDRAVESAGLCRIQFNEETQRLTASCYGESLTLQVKSRPDTDSDIIERTLNEARLT